MATRKAFGSALPTSSAAKITIAEAENIVQPGEIDPDCIHTPGIYVKRVVQVPRLKVRVGID